MKRPIISRLVLPGLTLALLGASACNEHKDDTVEAYGDDSSVAITGFKLKADAAQSGRLDSVFFSIDLKNAVVFNADSLPKGTDVTGLIPVITYPSSVSAAVINMDGEKRSGVIDYMKNPSDSVDFTGKVTLTLTAQDGVTKREYRLKVNVHQQASDTLMWDNLAEASLPSRLSNPRLQKTVSRNGKAWTLIQEKDGSFTLASNAAPGTEKWTSITPSVPSDVKVRSFAAADDAFYILDSAGTLFTSDSGENWISTGEIWESVTGGYGDVVLGIATENGQRLHKSYPAKYAAIPVAEDFPVSGQSNMGVVSSKWSSAPLAILAGGRNAEGTPTACVWGFDGFTWARISDERTPALAEATLIPYIYYRQNTSLGYGQTEYSVWLLLGGYNADGTMNRTVYMSYDNGVNWQPAVDYMQLPDMIPSFCNADALVLDEKREASLTNYWKRKPSRKLSPWYMPYSQDGYTLTWSVPYIYLFGGYNADGQLHDTMWRGVLNRLTFTPII